MSRPHNWFSLAEGAGWERRLPRQIFSTMSKDIRAVRNTVPCYALRALLSVLTWGPAVPGPVLPHAIVLLEWVPVGAVQGHGHPCSGLTPGPTWLSCERALFQGDRRWDLSWGVSGTRSRAVQLCGMCSSGSGHSPAKSVISQICTEVGLGSGFCATSDHPGAGSSATAWQKCPRGPKPPSRCVLAESQCPGLWGLSVWVRKSLPWGWGWASSPLGPGPGVVASVPVWKLLQPPTAPNCLCLSDEDFQARRQQLREEEETPKEGQ